MIQPRNMHDNIRTIIERRSRTIRGIRGFFDSRGYLEVDTPALSPEVIPEAPIEVFRTQFVHPHRPSTELYLLPSPEYWMKQLIAAGSGSIYQISHAFRNAENLGRIHNPEFTMLEWYTVGSDYYGSMEVCEELVRGICESLRDTAGSARAASGGFAPFSRLSMNEAFQRYAGVDLEAHAEGDSLRAVCEGLGITTAAEDSWADWFNRIFVDRVEPSLADLPSVLLYDYPSRVPTLARNRSGTPWAERWELYLDGIEVANCFTEEQDSQAVERFLRHESEGRRGALVPVRPADGFHHHFENNFPLCSGVALGVDRLIMALSGEPEIRGVILFPIHATLIP